MNLIPPAVLLLVVTSLTASLALTLVITPLLALLQRIPPRERMRWVFGLLATPLTFGTLVLTLAVGHCAVLRALGVPDDCEGFGGRGCVFCISGGVAPGAAAWWVVTFALTPLVLRLAALVRGIWSARRAWQRLRAVARPRPDGGWTIPGARAFVVGWPKPTVCIGEELDRALDRDAIAAVTAHEHAHRSHGDVLLRSLARLLAATHLPMVARPLLGALDLALEQACDERATDTVADPLLVADALLRATRLQRADGGELGGCASASLDARIEALCAVPSSTVLPPSLARAGGAFAMVLVVAVLLNHEVHRVAEFVSLLLPR